MTRIMQLSFFCLGLGMVQSTSAAGLFSLASVETLDAGGGDLFSLGDLEVGTVALGIASPLAGLPSNFADPDLVVETLFDDGFGFIPITYNDDSSADDNLDDETLGGLYRFETLVEGEHLVGVSGFGPGDEGDYFFVTGEVDPSSLGGDFDDTDGVNDTIAGADSLLLGDLDSAIAVNTLADVPGGDVDYYRVYLEAGDVFTAMTAPLGTDFYTLDTVLVMLDANGDFIFDDDDATGVGADVSSAFQPPGSDPDSGLGSALQFLVPESGEYFLAVTGFGPGLDDNIVPHSEVGDYALLTARVSVIPEPTSVLLAAMGMIGFVRRR